MRSHYGFDVFFSISLLSVFVVCAALLIFFQIDSYEHIYTHNEVQESKRLAQSYMTTLFHQRPQNSELYIEEKDDIPCLVLEHKEYDSSTYIYAYDGYLRELYQAGQEEIKLEDGDIIAPLQALQIDQTDTLFTFVFVYEDETKELFLKTYGK